MRDYLAGHIIGGPVDSDYDGAVLTQALAINDTVLHVDDVADFDEDASKRDAAVMLGVDFDINGDLDASTGTTLAYTTCDDDLSTVTLAAPSPVAGDVGDRVYIQDPVTGSPVGRLSVWVAMDDDDTSGDALLAVVDVSLVASTVGDMDLTDLAVDVEIDEDDQLVIRGFPGLANHTGGAQKFAQDQMTVTALGDQVLRLTYRPVVNSEHLYWEGIYQPGSEWSRDGYTVTVPDAGHLIKVGDELVMEYAHVDPEVRTTASEIRSSDGGVSPTTGTTYAVPIDTPNVGDIILLATARATAPVGWTLLQDASIVSSAHLRVYSKVSDGTETSVTVTYNSGEGVQRLAGITVVCTAASLSSSSSTEDPRVGSTYQAPAVTGTPLVSFAMYDGPGWPPDEHIISADTTLLANLKAETNGLYGLAAAEGRATFTSTTGSASSKWYAVTVGVV